MSARVWRVLHLSFTVAWLLAVVPTLLWWRDSVLWVALMSCWANVASHFAAWQAVRAEESNGNGGSGGHLGND